MANHLSNQLWQVSTQLEVEYFNDAQCEKPCNGYQEWKNIKVTKREKTRDVSQITCFRLLLIG